VRLSDLAFGAAQGGNLYRVSTDEEFAGVYNSGLLARDRPPADATYDYQQATPELIARATRIAAVCETYGVTLPEAVVAFVRRHPAVVSTVVGLSTDAQVTETIRRAGARVPDELWSALRAAGLIEPASA
jgi:aryl-alcohol dehydrogenase-like predicted oxidoreductase